MTTSDSVLPDPVFNVLFLCTGNSARSILAEALLNHHGAGAFRAYSAGSHPKGAVHPLAVELLKQMNMGTADLRSKSWDEFAGASAPKMDFIVTVCDNAADEVCPVWPGHPVTAHWGLPDPAAATGTPAQQMLAFREAFRVLEARVKYFLTFRYKDMSAAERKSKARDAGQKNPDIAT